MKKAFFTLAVLVMAFGNMGFAQSKAETRAKITERVFKLYGLNRESYIVPQQANFCEADGTRHRTTYYYDEWEYTLTEEISETYYDFWTNTARAVYEYDFYGNILEMLGQTWNGSGWDDMLKATYEYDGDVLSQVILQNCTGGVWMNVTKEVYNFNDDQWTVLYWTWNGTNWTSSELYTYTRYADSIELLIQYMEGGAWQNEAMEIYTLDFDENVTEIVYKEWNQGNNLWENYERMSYIYDNGVYTDQYQQKWDGTAWFDEYHYTYDYDAAGNAKHGMCFGYGGYDWAPDNGDMEMAYSNNAEKKIYYGSEVDLVYVDLTGVNENTQATNVKVYPVPAENELFIQTEGFQKAEVYNVTGQKLMESTTEKMNVSSLSQGVYLLKVYDRTGNIETQRVVIK